MVTLWRCCFISSNAHPTIGSVPAFLNRTMLDNISNCFQRQWSMIPTSKTEQWIQRRHQRQRTQRQKYGQCTRQRCTQRWRLTNPMMNSTTNNETNDDCIRCSLGEKPFHSYSGKFPWNCWQWMNHLSSKWMHCLTGPLCLSTSWLVITRYVNLCKSRRRCRQSSHPLKRVLFSLA